MPEPNPVCIRLAAVPGEDALEAAALIRTYIQEFRPSGPVEERLARTLCETDWDLRRYQRVHAELYCAGLGDPATSGNGQVESTLGRAYRSSHDIHKVVRYIAELNRTYERTLRNLRQEQAQPKPTPMERALTRPTAPAPAPMLVRAAASGPVTSPESDLPADTQTIVIDRPRLE